MRALAEIAKEVTILGKPPATAWMKKHLRKDDPENFDSAHKLQEAENRLIATAYLLATEPSDVSIADRFRYKGLNPNSATPKYTNPTLNEAAVDFSFLFTPHVHNPD
ncbi:MAG: hypothetical protein KGJ06_09665, partial [Pseudomonadota bacterium]|nr:hypothetical protein [Pseudomonadota bacterium]